MRHDTHFMCITNEARFIVSKLTFIMVLQYCVSSIQVHAGWGNSLIPIHALRVSHILLLVHTGNLTKIAAPKTGHPKHIKSYIISRELQNSSKKLITTILKIYLIYIWMEM